MATGMPNLLDIAKANGNDHVTGLIDETIKVHPELLLVGARTIKGIHYPTLIRTAVPKGQAFRNANEGAVVQKGEYAKRLVEAYIVNPRWECDKAVADCFEDGREAYIALEASAVMEGAMQDLASQFYYGIGAGGSAKGFPGLLAAYDATNMVIDAGGTTANTGSSVWGIKSGAKFCQWVWGLNGSLDLTPVSEQRVLDAANNPFTAYVQEIMARAGLQVGNLKCIGRIKKITADSGKTLTDAMIGQLVAKFPVGYEPDVLLMSRRSREQLRASRTATTVTGQEAAIPADWQGIKIAVTDAILDTEALTL